MLSDNFDNGDLDGTSQWSINIDWGLRRGLTLATGIRIITASADESDLIYES